VHLLNLPELVSIGPKDNIVAGSYYADDVTSAQLIVMAGRGNMTPLTEVRPLTAATKSILFCRMGGFGDLILLTPVLRELKRQRPDIKIAVATLGHYSAAIQNLPYIDEIIQYPVLAETANRYDAWVWFENAIERNPRAEVIHATDLFAEIAGMTWGDEANKCPDYAVKPSEAIWAQEGYPRKEGVKRVCIQIGTSALCRTYPRNQMGAVGFELLKRGYEVFLLGSKGEIKTPEKNPPGLYNLSDRDLTFRQSCAVLATADCMIGSDSALVHVAGALAVPAVGLYGPFPWKLRTAYAPTTHALNGVGDCAPCFHHHNPAKRNHFPEKCPSKDKGICDVLADIKPERIVAMVEKISRTPAPASSPFTVIDGGKA
jgi:ADP-heptose:LPS heptosyltransferase